MKIGVAVFLIALATPSISAQDLFSQQKIERLYQAGIDQLNRNQFGPARESFTALASLLPAGDIRAIECQYDLAYCALHLYHPDAEKMFANFVQDHANHPKALLANFELANFFYIEKNYEKAASYFRTLDFTILTNEQQNRGRFRFGYSLFNQRLLIEALEPFNVIKSQGGQYGPAASYYAGFIEYGQSDFDNAQKDLMRAEQNESYSKIVPLLLANVYYRQKKYDELLAYKTQLTGREGVNNIEEIELLAAEAYYKKGNNKEALAGYAAYLKEKEETADKGILLRAGHAAFTLGENDAALRYLKSSFSDKDSIGYYSAYYLGCLYLKKQQKPMALTAFEIARKFKSDKKLVEGASFQYAKIAYDLGRTDQAIAELEQLQNSFPKSSHAAETGEMLSQAYVNANNYNKAITYIESLPERSKAVERAYQKATLLKGQDLFNREDFIQAVQFFEKSIQHPIDQDIFGEANFWKGESQSVLKQYENAISSYQKVLTLAGYANHDILARSRYGLGYCFFNLRQYDRALFNFKEFVNKSQPSYSNYADGVLRLADCYYVSKDYTNALENYKNAIAAKTADADYAHLQAAVALGVLRKYTEAKDEFDFFVKNYPQSRLMDEALFQRAQLQFENGNYTSAVEDYSHVIKIFSSSRFVPYCFTRRAACYYNLKDFNKTSSDYITVLTDYPNHPAGSDVLMPLQEALTLAGRADEFDGYLANYKKANPDAVDIESVEFDASKNLYFNQDYAKAITRLNAYISQYPESPRVAEANYYLAESYYRTKNLTEALRQYQTISQSSPTTFGSKVIARIAELEFRQGAYANAIASYQRLSKVASNRKEQSTAWDGLMESYFFLSKFDSSRVYAETILQNGNANVGATNKATLYLGKIAKELGDFDLAKDEFVSTINSAQDQYGAEAKYLLGEVFFLTKEHKQCYETLVGLNTDFASYPEWVGKSYLLLSDNFLAQGDKFNAKAVLKSLEDNFPIEMTRNTAAQRLSKIDKLEFEQLQKVKSDSTENER